MLQACCTRQLKKQLCSQWLLRFIFLSDRFFKMSFLVSMKEAKYLVSPLCPSLQFETSSWTSPSIATSQARWKRRSGRPGSKKVFCSKRLEYAKRSLCVRSNQKLLTLVYMLLSNRLCLSALFPQLTQLSATRSTWSCLSGSLPSLPSWSWRPSSSSVKSTSS